jgi:hypothetical protein
MRALLGGVAAAALALSCIVAGCEAITSRDGLQCQVTPDCQARGAEFANTICSEGLCEKIIVPDGGSAQTCTDSESCLFSLGAPGRCISGQCVSFSPTSTVTNAQLCTTYGPVANDDAVLLGVIVPFGGSIAATQALGIASYPTGGGNTGTILNEILSVWNAKAVTQTPAAPQFAALVCDELDLAGSVALFQQAKPAFIVGPYSDAKLRTLISSTSTTPLLSPLGDGADLIASQNRWFCTANRSAALAPFQSSVDLLAKYIAKTRAKPQVSVQLLEDSAEPSEAQFANSLVSTSFTFNGESATEVSDAGAPLFQQVDIASGSSAVNIEDTNSSSGLIQANAVVNFQPDLVVLTGATWAPSLLEQIESRWATRFQGKVPPPYYLIMHTSPAVATFAQGGSQLSLKGRLFALDSDNSETTNGLNSNYQTFQTELSVIGISEPFGGTQYSDCTTLGMYGVTAAASSGTAPSALTAVQFSQGVAQVSQTMSANRGNLVATPDAIGNVLTLLANNQSVQLLGTSLYFGLDLATGMPALNLPAPSPATSPDQGHTFALQCAQTPPNSAGWFPAGVFYDKSAPGVPSSATIDCTK